MFNELFIAVDLIMIFLAVYNAFLLYQEWRWLKENKKIIGGENTENFLQHVAALNEYVKYISYSVGIAILVTITLIVYNIFF